MRLYFRHEMPTVITNGGATHGKKNARDCVARAFSIATGKPYDEIAARINELGGMERMTKRRRIKGRSGAQKGVWKPTVRKLAAELGGKWTPTMQVGQGCKVHLAAGELPGGRIVAQVSKHVVAVIDGVIHDTHDPGRDGTRCVYGYWTFS